MADDHVIGGVAQLGGETFELRKAESREPMATHVHRELRRAILRGRFPPQSRLIETELALQMNVSRTPVREAISKLESEGLVRRLKTGGCIVGENRTRFVEALVLRQCLEGAAARLACLRASDEELERIAHACERASELVPMSTVKTRSALDEDFHSSLARASHSPRLIALIEEFYEYSDSELLPPQDSAVVMKLQQQHVAIANALCARDCDAAERLVREHLAAALPLPTNGSSRA